MEAISHAGTVLGVLAKDGVVLAAEKKVTGKLLDLSGAKDGGYGGSGEKIYLLNSYALTFSYRQISCLTCFPRNVIGGVAGLTADANSLVNFARTAAQRHLLMYNEDIPVELLAQRLCDMKQGYTQYGGMSVALVPLIHVLTLSQVFGPLVFPCSMLATIPTTTSSFTTPIPQVTIQAGKRHVLARTTGLHKVY